MVDRRLHLGSSWVPTQTSTGKHMPLAPFEPAEVKMADRQDDAVLVVVQSGEGGRVSYEIPAGSVSAARFAVREGSRTQPTPPTPRANAHESKR
jgi:hypothetical protein